MSDIHIHIDRETPVKVITLEPNGARGAAATVTVGTTTTGNAGTNASVTNSGTSSAAVLNFTIPRGDTGAAGPNSVTSATTSDGTANLSLASLTLGTSATFNAVTYTFGTGAATAFKNALAINVDDITFDGGIVTTGTGSSISTTGIDSDIFTDNDDSSIYTLGNYSTIYTEGETSTIYTGGTAAHILTQGGGHIQTSSTFKISGGGFITTLSGTQTADRAIAFPDASGTVALTVSTAINEKIEMQGGGESGFVAPNFYAYAALSASLREGNTGLACLTWGDSGAQNLTIPSGTAFTLNNTSFTYGAGAASAHRTALEIGAQEVKSANFTAADKGEYVATATLTVTDPTPSEGANFSVLVRNGTATVGGTAYAVAGTLIRRVFHSGAWQNYPYSSALFGANVATYLATPTVANWRAATSGTSDLVTVGPNEVSITGATTLTSTAFGLIHVCSGTSADYQVDLPSVSGNAGRIITIRMSNALTRFVTIAGAGGALIDGLATRLMWAQESCVLMCDGTNWTKIAGKSRPMVFSGENGAGITVANATNVPISIATILQNNTGLMNDTVSSIVVCRIRRAGVYALSALATLNRSGSFAGFEAYSMIFLNATTSLATAPAMLAVVPTAIDTGGLNTYAHVNYAVTRTLAANDYLCLGTFQNTGGNMTTRTVNVVRPNISVTEIPNW
jgi:hypothetical protein